MNPERYARLKELVLTARKLSPEARTAYLEREAGADPSLRRDAEDLLAGDADAPDLLASGLMAGGSASEVFSRGSGSLRAGPPPERIGPYHIVGILGEGGMGVVYHARQTEPIQREVALKLVRRGLDTERVVARFESERQALALMDHPGIARVLDAGADERGLPYFVMELVHGMPLVAYADSRRLNLQGRLQLFLDVCRAVQHAHQKGIIHRDLKPSNVLVTEQDGKPQPKVIDFGIAKALEETASERSLLTQEGQILGTPEYMSPEQASGRPEGVDTRTDVYSLGVLLYELLTGERPYRLRTAALREIQQVIAEKEPDRPSIAVARRDGGASDSAGADARLAARGTTLDRLRRQLAGDLDNILLMSLRKEPDRRYSSVEQFAEDLRRHLDGLPVRARKDTFTYRAGKFVRRNRVPVAAGAAAALLLAALAGIMAVQSARIAQQRDRALAAESRAEQKATTARRVSDFLVDLFSVADPQVAQGDTISARHLLDKGAEKIHRELTGEPEIQAALMTTMSRAYSGIGIPGRAVPLADSALATRIRLHGEESLETAESRVVLGAAHASLGEMAEAERAYRRGLEIRRKLLGPDHELIVEAASLLALELQTEAHFPEAETLYREVLAMMRRLHGENAREVTGALSNLGGICHAQGKIAEADSLLTLALARARTDGSPPIALADILAELAVVLKNQKRLDEAEPCYREALEIRERILGEHALTAQSYNNLGVFLRTRGDEKAALPHLRRALEIYRRIKGENHPDVAIAWTNLARTLSALKQDIEAESTYLAALRSADNSVGREYWVYSQIEHNYGAFLCDRRRYREAEPLLLRSYEGLKKGLGSDARRTQMAVEKIVDFYVKTGRPAQASRYRALLAPPTAAVKE